MARLAIFIDGGYMRAVAYNEYSVRVDYSKFANEILVSVANKTADPVDLLRTYYYDCLPFQSENPTIEERNAHSGARSFFHALQRIERFAVRQGRLAFRGHDSMGRPILQQKGVDLMLGLDFATLSVKGAITHAVLVTGDSDFVPAIAVAKQEGITVWLYHGPRVNSRGDSTFAEELWLASDERVELTKGLLESVSL